MELAVVMFPGIRLGGFPVQDQAFDVGQLMMGRQHCSLPLDVSSTKRLLHCVLFEKQSQGSYVLQIVDRNRHDQEAALPLCQDEPLSGQPIENLAQSGDTRRIGFSETIQSKPFARSEPAESDVSFKATVNVVTDA